jgi:hypothetical protein
MWGGRSKGRHENSGTSVGVGLGIGFEDDAIAEAFETAPEVCDGSGREVAAKGKTAGLVQHVEGLREKETAKQVRQHAHQKPGLQATQRSWADSRPSSVATGKDQSLRES